MEDTTTPSSETSSAKKRAAAERDQDSSTCGGTPGSGFHDDDEIQEPCGKKQKLTKKELLEQAKARLKEAQEKKKMLQQKLEEEKANAEVAEAEQQCWDDYPPYHHYGGSYFEEEYYYEYHIPPVTGSKDSLLITEIESTGPSEKVRFQIDKHSCIEAVMKVITDRRRSLSPSNALHGAPPMPTPVSYANANMNNAANPQGPPQGPPMPPSAPPPSSHKDNKASTSSDGGGGGRMISEGSSSVNSATNNSISTSSHSKPAALDEGLKSQRPNHYHKRSSIHSNADHPPSSGDRDRDRERRHSHTTPVQPPRMPRQINNNTRSRSSGDASMSMPPSMSSMMKQPPPPPPNNKEQPPRRSSSGPQQLQMQPPPRPLKRPWKLALAQITGKTLDFSADLPTKMAYLIRTQDQGVVAHVQFFSSPANPSLLEHHPSKRHLQDHFVPLGRLPSHSSQSWKGQEILSFLKHQDERRKTYQPPARRNLPFTHWALLDLEQPLHQAMESTGYFTAAPVNNGSNNGNNNNNNNSNNISFAGKLIWNMHDFYQSSSSQQQQSQQPLSKLSKWGEVVSAVATSGIRNSPLIATVQGFYELPPTAGNNNNRDHHNKLMPPALRARKVILPKSRTIGIIIGSNAHLSQQQLEANNKNGNAGNNNNNNNNNSQMQVGCCQVLFPNGMASGPPSAQSLKGARAILYD